jgi:hypothetical protein
MQTFLPYPDIKQSVECLDNKRLGKQRVEAFQIFKALTISDYGWKNHPATLMWKGYEPALLYYVDCCIIEWIRRGFNNTMKRSSQKAIVYPKWFGDNRFHSSHRSNLLRKDKEYYSRFNWKESPNMDYFWPTKEGYLC